MGTALVRRLAAMQSMSPWQGWIGFAITLGICLACILPVLTVLNL